MNEFKVPTYAEHLNENKSWTRFFDPYTLGTLGTKGVHTYRQKKFSISDAEKMKKESQKQDKSIDFQILGDNIYAYTPESKKNGEGVWHYDADDKSLYYSKDFADIVKKITK